MPRQARPFLLLTFEGDRFNGHSAPVDVLGEFSTFQQIVFQVARRIYLEDNPARIRVPNGFPDAAQLHLIASEPNCFTATLARVTADSAEGSHEDYFARALDRTMHALASISAGGVLPSDFPADAFEGLAALGRRLGPAEAMLLRTERAAAPVRVDQGTRRRLAAALHRQFEQQLTVDGEVVEVDDADRRCALVAAGRRVEIPFRPHERDIVLAALGGRPIARLRVRGLLQIAGASHRFLDVDDIELVDHELAPDVQAVWDRIRAIQSIGDGWLDGAGRSPSSESIAVARDVLSRVLIEHGALPRPRVFPTPDGGIQAESTLGVWALEISFPPEIGSVVVDATHVRTGHTRSHVFGAGELSLDDATSLVDWIRSNCEGGA